MHLSRLRPGFRGAHSAPSNPLADLGCPFHGRERTVGCRYNETTTRFPTFQNVDVWDPKSGTVEDGVRFHRPHDNFAQPAVSKHWTEHQHTNVSSRSVRTSGSPKYAVIPGGLCTAAIAQLLVDVARATSSPEPVLATRVATAAALVAEISMTDGQRDSDHENKNEPNHYSNHYNSVRLQTCITH